MTLSLMTILGAIFDKQAYNIFKSVATAQLNSDILITQLKLTRKQYYSRMSRLIKAGMVKRQNGRYFLTEFGKVIYDAYANLEATIESALDNYWKLKAIDSLQMFSREERMRVVCELIDNQEIRNIILNQESQLRIEAVSKESNVHERMLTIPNKH